MTVDIFRNEIIEFYNNRQSKVDQLCLTQFASYYYKNTFGENHYQPTELAGNITDEFLCKLPKIIKLETVRGTMVRRKSKVVLWYQRPNITVRPELANSEVIKVVETNQQLFEPDSELDIWCQVQSHEER